MTPDTLFWIKWSLCLLGLVVFVVLFRAHARSKHEREMDRLARENDPRWDRLADNIVAIWNGKEPTPEPPAIKCRHCSAPLVLDATSISAIRLGAVVCSVCKKPEPWPRNKVAP